jgi:hypothetical protein
MKRAKLTRPSCMAVAFAARVSPGAGNVLFIGNSFTFAFGSPVDYAPGYGD